MVIVSVGDYESVTIGDSSEIDVDKLDSEALSLIHKITGPLTTTLETTKNRFQMIDVEDIVKCFNHLSNMGFKRRDIISSIMFRERTFAQRMADSGYKLNSQTGLFSRDSKKGSKDALEKSFKEPSQEKRLVLRSDTSLSDLSSSVVSSDKIKKTSPTPRLDNQLINSINSSHSSNTNSNSNIIFSGFSDLEKHLLEQTHILLQQKILLLEQQEVLIKEIREVNAKVDFSPFYVLSSKFDDVLTSIGPTVPTVSTVPPRSISSDYVDYSDWLQIKWSKPYKPYDATNKTFDKTITRSFAVHPKLLDLFKISYRGRKTQVTAINQAMLDYCMKIPDASRIVQRFLSSPDELHSLVEFDSDVDE
jgi:hypothetical protein